MAGVDESLSSGALGDLAVGGGGGGGGGGSEAGGCRRSERSFVPISGADLIFSQPDRYIGSVRKRVQKAWVCGGQTDLAMVFREVTHIPGLSQMFDEILLNASDNKFRDSTMGNLKVYFNQDAGSISVHNDGLGLPVVENKGVYHPEIMFSQLGATSNGPGSSGMGAKLVNLFSTKFIIETCDGCEKYKQIFSENMSKKTDPEISKCSKRGTTITFYPDFSIFGITSLEDIHLSLMRRRVLDMAGTLGPSVQVHMDELMVPKMSFFQYVELYIGAEPGSEQKYPRVYEHMDNNWEICATLSQGKFQHISFVTRIATIKGGSHVDCMRNQIAERVTDQLKMKHNR